VLRAVLAQQTTNDDSNDLQTQELVVVGDHHHSKHNKHHHNHHNHHDHHNSKNHPTTTSFASELFERTVAVVPFYGGAATVKTVNIGGKEVRGGAVLVGTVGCSHCCSVAAAIAVVLIVADSVCFLLFGASFLMPLVFITVVMFGGVFGGSWFFV
jgi:hypothetical protein